MNDKLNQLKDKIKNMSTETILEVAKSLKDTTTEEANIIMDICFNELEKRMEEKDFILFCQSLE